MRLIARAAAVAGAGAVAGGLLTPAVLAWQGPWLAALAALTTAGAFGILSSRLMRPLGRLTDSAELPTLGSRADEIGELARAIAQMHDRLEHRNAALTRAYLTVMESERRLAAIIDNLNEALLVVDTDGVINRVNPAAAHLFGHDGRTLVGQRIEVLGWQVDALETMTREPQRARTASGELVPVEVGVTRVEQGGRTSFCVLVRDLSARLGMEHEVRQSREFLQRVIELMPVAIFLKDAATMQFTMVNRAMERLCGVPQSRFAGSTCHEHPALGAELIARFDAIERRIATGETPGQTLQYVLPGAEGPRTVRATTVGLRGVDGRVSHLVGVVEDLTDEIATQNELERQKLRAEAAHRAKSEFLANMSHELRTPLNAIIGYGEMLDETALEENRPQESRDLQRIVGAGRHLLTLINSVLELAKSESGRMRVRPAPVDVERLIADATSLVEPLMLANGNRLTVAGSVTGSCISDEAMLRSILTNLLDNAAKFTRGGEVSLSYEVGARGAEFRVRDTGISIAPESQRLVFEPFVQADTSTVRGFGGAGLGLALCRRYCDRLGGEIRLDSELGRGAAFTVCVPSLDKLVGGPYQRLDATIPILEGHHGSTE